MKIRLLLTRLGKTLSTTKGFQIDVSFNVSEINNGEYKLILPLFANVNGNTDWDLKFVYSSGNVVSLFPGITSTAYSVVFNILYTK